MTGWEWLSQLMQVFADLIPRPLIVRTDERCVEFVIGAYPRVLNAGWYIEWPLLARYEVVQVRRQVTPRSQRFGEHAYQQDRFEQLQRALMVEQVRCRELQSGYDHMRREMHKAQQDFEMVMQEMVPKFVPTSIPRRSKPKASDATAVLAFSDLHYEERVDPKTIHGINEYDRTIATSRVNAMVSKTMEQIDMFRQMHNIKHFVLWAGGDLMSGAIHDELMENNELPPAKAAYEVSKLLADVVETFHAIGGFETIDVLFNDGNHGRSTKKTRVATRSGNSWEWLAAKMLEWSFTRYTNIRWTVAEGEQIIHQVQDRPWRFLHGDTIRYQGGVGGLTIPANKAVAQWNRARPCYHTLFGHWHQYLRERDWTSNGSVIGYGPFSQHIKGQYEPPQQALLIADREGIRQNTAIQLAKGLV